MFALTLLLAACGPSAPAPTPEAAAPPPAAAPAPAPSRADAANTKLPPGLAGLRFEERSVTDARSSHTTQAVVPVGWVEEAGWAGWFKPPKEANLGWMTAFKVGTNCAGACEPKDWKAVIEKELLAAIPDKVRKGEETLPENGRVRWGADASTAWVQAAWYTEGASNYTLCTATLDSPALVPAVDAFVEACKATRPG